MTENEISEVFMNLEDIYQLNKKMRDTLVNLRYKGDQQLVKGISQVLLTFTPFFKVFLSF